MAMLNNQMVTLMIVSLMFKSPLKEWDEQATEPFFQTK